MNFKYEGPFKFEAIVVCRSQDIKKDGATSPEVLDKYEKTSKLLTGLTFIRQGCQNISF